LQFLDKHNADTTAIGYDEKLQKYLESVLIGDELAEKIRAAFDAYVFLSYRKKDRRYAQELMRLIHKNEFCRDIAIWYDEFLTPGENFNDSIKKALQKSGLFVLTVTPNLINEQNYIMTTEYPMAKQEGKPILPTELVPTDRKQLEEKYEGIPVPTDAHNESELSEALLESIKKMAIKENDNSPDHNFFIGLAYLGGVDVEVDYERALRLISSAAETGHVEAIKRITTIYLEGVGIKQDFDSALQWQNRLVQILYKKFSIKASEGNAIEYGKALWLLGDIYYNLGNADASICAYKKMQEFCLSLDEKFSRISRRFLKIACIKLADIYEEKGDYKRTEHYIEQCLYVIENQPSGKSNVDTKSASRDLIFVYERLGNLYLHKDDMERALDYYNRALENAEAINKISSSVESVVDLARCYGHIGEIYVSKSILDKAKSSYTKEYELLIGVCKTFEEDSIRRELLRSCDHMAKLYEIQGDLKERYAFSTRSLELIEQIVQKANFIEDRKLLADTYVFHGDSAYMMEDYLTAESLYYRALDIYNKLQEQNYTLFTANNIGVCYGRIGRLYLENNKLSQAISAFQKEIEIFEELNLAFESFEVYSNLAGCYKNMGDALKENNDLISSIEYYEKTLEISKIIRFNKRIISDLNVWDCCESIVSVCVKLAERALNEGRFDDAKRYYDRIIEVKTERLNSGHHVNARQELLKWYEKINSHFTKYAQPKFAICYCAEALEHYRVLAQKKNTADAQLQLAIGHIMLAQLKMDSDDLPGCCQNYKTGIVLCDLSDDKTKSVKNNNYRFMVVCYNELMELSITNCDRDTYLHELDELLRKVNDIVKYEDAHAFVVECYIKVGDCIRYLGNHTLAKAFYEKGHCICEKFINEYGTIELYRWLGICYSRIGRSLKQLESFADAKTNYIKAVDVTKHIVQKTEAEDDYVDYAITLYNLGLLDELDSLRKAYSIWEYLSEKYPDKMTYKEECKKIQEMLG